ncbi:MAG: PAS domain S-box protein, partial [Chloroflexi bacterium]|nr:PAS domain S-box protein [Chloroflexota bacterium]
MNRSRMKQVAALARNPHLWAIVALTVFLSLIYYGDQLNVPDWVPLRSRFFNEDYVHDLHRALFLLPMIYAPLVFRVKGGVAISAAALCVVMPRAVFVSENPDPVLRPVIFLVLAGTASIMLGLERERRQKLTDEVARRRLAERARMQLAAIVTSSEDAIIGKTLDGVITSWNRGAQNLYGYSVEEAVGRHVSFLVPEDANDDISSVLEKIGLGEVVERYETTRLRKDGTRVPVSLTVSPIRDEEGTIVGASAIARDITPRKQAEEARRHSEERFRTVADFTYDWEYWVGADGKFVWVSPSFERVTGYTVAELLDAPGLLNRIAHPDDRSVIEQHLGETFDSGNANEIEFRIITRSGEERWIHHICRPVCGANGQRLGRRATNRDVTEEKRIERALRQSEDNYARMVNAMQEMLLVVDERGQILFVNHRAAENLGDESPGKVIGRNLADFVPREYAEDHIGHARKAIDSGETEAREVNAVMKGRPRWFRQRIVPIVYGTPGRPAALSMSLDITE